jgi:hypothetical protein
MLISRCMACYLVCSVRVICCWTASAVSSATSEM